MAVKEFVLEKAEDIHSILKRYRKSTTYKFRGQSDADWILIPKAGRSDFLKVPDESLFRHWKRRAEYSFQANLYSDWDYLAIAQHNGLPTRFLDWSLNP